MRSKGPDVTGPRHRRAHSWRIGNLVLRARQFAIGLGGGVQHPVDVCRFEACKLDIEIEINELLQFDRQNFPVPPGLLGQPVVGQDVRPLLGCRQVGEPDRG